MLAEARSVEDLTDVADKADAVRLYLKRRGAGLDVQNRAAELKIRAERSVGTMLEDVIQHQGGRPTENGNPGLPLNGSPDEKPVKLADLGVTKKQSSKWQKLADIHDDEFDELCTRFREEEKELTTAGILSAVREPSAPKPQKQRTLTERAIQLFRWNDAPQVLREVCTEQPDPHQKERFVLFVPTSLTKLVDILWDQEAPPCVGDLLFQDPVEVAGHGRAYLAYRLSALGLTFGDGPEFDGEAAAIEGKDDYAHQPA